MRSNYNINEGFTFSAVFWMPKKPKERLTGSLTFSLENGISLNLIGGFSTLYLKDVMESEIPIINGLNTYGDEFILLNSSFRRINVSGITSSIIYASKLIIGQNFTEQSELLFDRISIKLNNLRLWLGLNGFNIKYKRQLFSGIDFDYSPKVYFKIGNQYRATLYSYCSSSRRDEYMNEILLGQDVSLNIRSTNNNKLSLDDWLSLVYKLQMFFTFATHSNSYPLEINFFPDTIINNSKSEARPIQLFQKYYIGESQPSIHFFRMFFTFKNIEGIFPRIINEWIKTYDKLNPIVEIFNSQFSQSKMSPENRFLNMAQALESFHRKFKNYDIIPKNEYKKRVKIILDSIPKQHSEYIAWIKQIMDYANGPNLKDRLMDLLKIYSNPTLKNIIKDKEDFANKVRDSRNYYTHYSEAKKKKALVGDELINITWKMRALLSCGILDAIGFNKKEIKKIFKEGGKYYYGYFHNE